MFALFLLRGISSTEVFKIEVNSKELFRRNTEKLLILKYDMISQQTLLYNMYVTVR